MSISKSRWKGALLATVAASVLSPLAVKAQSMSISLSLSPLGTTAAYGGSGTGYNSGYATTEYIPPDQATPIYVYATITGASAPASNYVDGLQYVYYNINTNGVAGVNTAEGKIISATPNAALGFNANGSQAGVTNFSSGTIAVGDASAMSNMAKPRSAAPVWSSSPAALANDGTNVIVSGSTISFLVETLMYQPAFSPIVAGSATPASNTFSLSVPTLPANYAPANYFVGEPTTPSFSSNQGGGASFTHTGYTVSGSGVTLVDAVQGDANLDGFVNGGDLAVVESNFNAHLSGWTNGDLNGDGFVNGGDLSVIENTFNAAAGGPSPAGGIAGPTALIGSGSAVPEPTSLSLVVLGAAAMLKRRRR